MHASAIAPAAGKALKKLRASGILTDFYLAGGTAVALQLGHRISEDLDFFSARPFDPTSLTAVLGGGESFTATLISPGALWGVFGATKVSFFYYPYPLLKPLLVWEDIKLASLLDIGLMKLIAVAPRGSRKDFVDVYAICTAGYSLAELVDLLSQKFGERFSRYHILRSLTYFQDAEAEPPLVTTAALDWSRVRAFFKEETVRIAAREVRQ